jgi:hypothetical protein
MSPALIDEFMRYSDRLFNFYLLVKDVSDEMGMVFILQTVGLIAKTESGVDRLVRNREILAMIIMALIHESATVQNEAAFQIKTMLDNEQLHPALMELPIYQYIT